MPSSSAGPDRRRSAGAINRRDAIRVGSLGLAGLSLDRLLRLQAASAASSPPRGRAKSAILLFLSGGPAHMDMWDLKPGAPEAVRGTFRPIDTNVAGINKFSGLFTGPNAEEVIGNFALPYRSPIDSQTYQAAGGFVAKGP